MVTLIDYDGSSLSYNGTLEDAITIFHINKDCYWKICVDGQVVMEWKLAGGQYECIHYET